MAEVVETKEMDTQALQSELAQHGVERLPEGVMVYEIAGPMFFGAVENFERALLQTHTDPKALIIRMRRVPFMDITGIQTLEAVIAKLRKRGIQVVLSEANTRVLGKLRRAGVIGEAGAPDYADQFIDAIGLLGLDTSAQPA
jgi:SulP family sulfate permease